MPPTPIAILGAGPSGLTLARILHRAGIPSTLFERDASPTARLPVGGTLDLHAGSGLRAIQAAGLMNQFGTLARSNVSTKMADASGEVLVNLSGEGDDDRPEIDRRDLRAMLVKSVPGGSVRWGGKVESVQRDENGSMAIHFADGSVAPGFRLVVGADGAWSKVRSLLTPARPQYSGLHFFTTALPPSDPQHAVAASLAGRGNYIGAADGELLTVMFLGDGSYHFGLGVRLPEHPALLSDASTPLRQALLRDHFTRWAPLVRTLIRESRGEFRPWPLYDMPPEALAWRSVPGVTVIGDAAHVATPFMGEGVNSAMTDSVELAQLIQQHGLDDLDAAVAEYEKGMFPRGRKLIEGSRLSGELMLAPDSPRSWLKGMGIPIGEE